MANRTKPLFQTSMLTLLTLGLAVALPADDTTRTAQVVSSTAAVEPSPVTATAAQAEPAKLVSAKILSAVQDLSFSQTSEGLKVMVASTAPLHGRISALKNPERILVIFPNASLQKHKLAKEINRGAVLRGRLAQHPDDSVWLVLDLAGTAKSSGKATPKGYTVTFEDAAPRNDGSSAVEAPVASAPVASHLSAILPKINLMFFDLNVMFQGKQFERFPCANFIYDKTDQFPLKREFVTTLVFYEGYGAFVGNLHVVDSKGNIIWQTQDPFAFNLFNELYDYSIDVPIKLEFPERGYYSLVLRLNGEDVREQSFYVGYTDDAPSKAKK